MTPHHHQIINQIITYALTPAIMLIGASDMGAAALSCINVRSAGEFSAMSCATVGHVSRRFGIYSDTNCKLSDESRDMGIIGNNINSTSR